MKLWQLQISIYSSNFSRTLKGTIPGTLIITNLVTLVGTGAAVLVVTGAVMLVITGTIMLVVTGSVMLICGGISSAPQGITQ